MKVIVEITGDRWTIDGIGKVYGPFENDDKVMAAIEMLGGPKREPGDGRLIELEVCDVESV